MTDETAEIGLISNFIKQYDVEQDYHHNVAFTCHNQCRDILQREGIRHLATFRAKQPDSVKDKLEQRRRKRQADGKQPYSSYDAIKSDIKDLSGVRIALYFPGERKRATKLLQDQFVEIKVPEEFPKPVPDYRRGSDIYAYRFPGYSATHLTVRLDKKTLDKDKQRYRDAIIEIQIASVVMHAWSEVEHDLVYKPLQGDLSEAEYALLDQINGLAYAEEIALKQLQAAMLHRVMSSKNSFQNQYELASFIDEALSVSKGHNLQMGRVDILHHFLSSRSLDTPERLRPRLPSRDRLDVDVTVVEQVAGKIIGSISNPPERESLEREWNDLKKTEGVAPPLRAAELDLLQAKNEFESHWRTLKTALLQLLSQRGKTQAWVDEQVLKHIPELSSKQRGQIVDSDRIFLQMTQQGRTPSLEDLQERTKQLKQLLELFYIQFPTLE